MEKMNAVVAYAPGDFRYQKVRIPSVNDETILVKILAAGICGGDRKIYNKERVWWKQEFPYIPGHEFIGEVVEIGKKVARQYGLKIGDHAIAEIIVPCSRCYYCLRGSYHFCLSGKYYGSELNGGWAEYMRYEEKSIVWKVPKLDPIWTGSLIEPLTCAIHGIERGGVNLKDTVVVSGMGSIGLLMTQVLKLKTPRLLVALDVKDGVLSVAKELGADITINVEKEDALGRIMDITNGLGCDVFTEASDAGDAIRLGLAMLRKRGRLVIFGVYSEETPVDFSYISDMKELDVMGCHISPNTYSLAIEYLADKLIDVKKVVTHIFSLNNFLKGLATNADTDTPRGKVISIP